MPRTAPERLLILISLVQGLCLLVLHQSIDLKFWPYSAPQWLFAFYSLVLIGPTMLLLSLEDGNEFATTIRVAPYTFLCGLLGFYVGYQAIPLEHINFSDLLFGFSFTMGIATFKALMYSQHLASGEKFEYRYLFRWSWRNFLTLALSALFALCIWGVLMLWAALFKAIKIHFFYDLFTETWFYYPAISLANGFGVIIFRKLTNVIDTITRLQQALMKFLLVVLCFVSLLFLAALPFTGLAPLWDTGGSLLILWMQALILFCINAVYQDDAESRPYPLLIHRFIYISAALLPLYSGISFYGLSLRVTQYGWSIDRCWAFLIWFLLAIFAFGYTWGIAKQRDNWLRHLSKINVSMGLVLLGCLLLINSPLLDFRKIVVSSQLAQVTSGKITLDELDIQYFKRELARPGFLALQNIKRQYADTHPLLVKKIDAGYSDKDIPLTREEFISSLTLITGEPPDSLIDAMLIETNSNRWQRYSVTQRFLIAVDANADGQQEYILATSVKKWGRLKFYYFQDSEWKARDLRFSKLPQDLNEKFFSALKTEDIEVLTPEWNEIKIKEHRFIVD